VGALNWFLSSWNFHSYALDVSGQDWTDAAKARLRRARLREMDARRHAMRAKDREIEAHRRAIKLHEDAVIFFDRFHQTGRSRDARQRVERAREMLHLALVEQAQAEGGRLTAT
jgi:hypothetical protein